MEATTGGVAVGPDLPLTVAGPPAPVPATAPPVPARRAARVETWPLSVVVMAVAVAAGVIDVVTTYGRAFYFYGDEAVLGLRVIDATHLQALLGPYSRFGWSHPGPALFYLLAPLYRLSGNDPRALTAGALLINGACLVATVAVVRRFAGEWTARWSVAVVGIAVLALGLNFFETFWNPTVEAAAMLLAVVLAAAAISGSGLAVVGLALVGSYVVQTDVGTALSIAFLAVAAVIGWGVQTAVRVRRERRQTGAADRHTPAPPPQPGLVGRTRAQQVRVGAGRTTRWVLAVLGGVVLVVMWIPPVHQQLTGHPGNLWALWHFFSTPTPASVGRSHSLADAWSIVANSTTTVPWGNPAPTVVVTHASYGREVTVVVWAVLSAVAVAWAALRRRWFALGLGVVTLGGLVVAVIAATRIVGPVSGYLTYWMALLPVACLMAVGDLTVAELVRVTGRTPAAAPAPAPVGRAHTRRRADRPWRTALAWVVAVALVVPAVAVTRVWASGTGQLASAGDPEIGQLASFATAHLRAGTSRDVQVVIGNADRWPEAAGLALQLRREGYRPTVDPTWSFMFTPRMVADGSDRAHLVLTDPVPGAAPGATSATFADGDVPTTITFVPAPVAGGTR